MEKQKNIKRYLGLSVVILLLGCVHGAAKEARKGAATSEERKAFLSTHNDFRRDASKEFDGTKQPPAANMKRMYWSAGLEAEAVNWVAHIVKKDAMEHGTSEVKNLPEVLKMLNNSKKTSLGQNLGAGIDNATTLVRVFYKETKGYTFKNHECAKDAVCGHYTQVMWSNSHFLGCAFGRASGKAMFSVCNYFPPGNWRGERPYKDGASCSLCNIYSKEGFTECEDGLCQPKDKCSPVKECKVVDTDNCLCSDADYNALVDRLVKANGLRLSPSSLLLVLSVVVVDLLVSPIDIA